MPTSRDTLEHLLSCCDAVYLVLGESAPLLSNDAYVVRVHEMSRSFGELTLAMRSQLGGSDGPRLLVSLRDARDALGDDREVTALLEQAARVGVAQILAVGEVAKALPPIEDPAWQVAARELAEMLENSGNADSFGLSG